MDHRKESVETGRPAWGLSQSKTGRRQERQEGLIWSSSSGGGQKGGIQEHSGRTDRTW